MSKEPVQESEIPTDESISNNEMPRRITKLMMQQIRPTKLSKTNLFPKLEAERNPNLVTKQMQRLRRDGRGGGQTRIASASRGGKFSQTNAT